MVKYMSNDYAQNENHGENTWAFWSAEDEDDRVVMRLTRLFMDGRGVALSDELANVSEKDAPRLYRLMRIAHQNAQMLREVQRLKWLELEREANRHDEIVDVRNVDLSVF